MDLETIIKNAPLLRQEQVKNITACKTKSVQVSGTNGKGSTCAFLSAIFKAHGKRAGVYTSPHITDICERIEVAGEYINRAELESLVNGLNDRQKGMCKSDLLFFAAVEYFNAKAVDFAVFETGLGGTKDSATLINHEYGIITKLSLDHTELLGDTIEEITAEKAGIIKKDMMVYSYPNECEEIIAKRCREKGAELKMLHQEDCAFNGGFSINAFGLNAENVRLLMKGDFQGLNCALALLCARDMLGNEFNLEKAVNAVCAVNVFGRITELCKNPLVIADVSHNPDGINALCSYVKTLNGKKCAVAAIPKHKDYKTMGMLLNKCFDRVLCFKADETSVNPCEIGGDMCFETAEEAYKKAMEQGFEIIVFCGSFAAVREAKKFF
ncbi:MAG: hypothetical protein IJR47_01640 [Clostridia bacterium]|nr:hypothetical protein [Clostridia bacterium]